MLICHVRFLGGFLLVGLIFMNGGFKGIGIIIRVLLGLWFSYEVLLEFTGVISWIFTIFSWDSNWAFIIISLNPNSYPHKI